MKQRAKHKGKSNFAYLFKEYYRYGKRIFYIEIIVALMVPFQTLLSVYLQQNVIDIVLNKSNNFVDLFPVVLSHFFFSVIIGVVISVINIYVLPNLNLTTNSLLTNKIYKQAQHTDLSYYDDTDFYNNYTWTLTEYVRKCRGSKDVVIGLIKSLLNITSLLFVITSTSPVVVVIVFVVVIFNSILNFKQKNIQLDNDVENLDVRREQNYISRIFYLKEYAEDLRVSSLGELVHPKFFNNIKRQINVNNKYRRKNIAISIIRMLISCSSTALMFLYLGRSLSNKSISAGVFSAVYTSSLSLKNNLIALFDWGVKIKTLSSYADRIKVFFGMNNPNESIKEEQHVSVPHEVINICIKNLSFSYNNTTFALDDINLLIRYGEKIVIVGDNGSGKSTLIKLLMRLYSPTSGEILINDFNLRDINIASYRNNIRYFGSSTMLYAYSLLDNIYINRNVPEANKEELDHLFNALKGKVSYDTCLTNEFDPNGRVLSSGESQLIKLERTFLKSASVSFFDEPCMNLDYNNEQKVMDRIMKLDGTVIVVTHNVYAVQNATRIIFMKNGKITEIGSHRELMHNHGDYYAFYSSKNP